MKLSVLERIQLIGLLPKEGDFSTLKIIRGIQSDLSFSEEELKETGLAFENNQYTWQKPIEKDIQIGEKCTAIIKDSIKKLDEQKKISMELYGLCEKFMEAE